MEMEGDADYISFLKECFSPCRRLHIVEKPDGVSSPSYVKNDEPNPNFVRKPKRKRNELNWSTKEVEFKKPGGERARYKLDCVQSWKRMKENNEGLRGKMEIEGDPDYISYLEYLSPCRKPHIVEKRPDGVYSPNYVKNDEINPIFLIKPKCKRSEHDWSTKEVVLKKSEGERVRFKPDLVPLKERSKQNKEGLRGKKPVSRGSYSRVYESDYFNFLTHLKVLETGIALDIGGEVMVRYELEVDTVQELGLHNNSFEEERENMVGNNVLVQERPENDLYLETEARENEDVLLLGDDRDDETGQLGVASSSLKKSAIQFENDSVIAQVVGCAEVSVKTDNRIEFKKHKVVENGSQTADQSEELEIDPGQASQQSEPVPPHLRAFMLLMKKLCPAEKTIYSGFSGNEVAIRPMGEPSTSDNLEKELKQDNKRETSNTIPRGFFDFDWIEEKKEEEQVPARKLKFRHKGNRRGHIEMQGLAGYPDISDSEEGPQIEEIPAKILDRPDSDYKNRLIEVLRRPYDTSEYRELMVEASIRKRKFIYKQLRSGERAMETNEESKSFFDWYPELRNKVERAERGRRLTLLRGLFFWLQNCCCKESFKPWEKGVKSSKVYHTINDRKDLL